MRHILIEGNMLRVYSDRHGVARSIDMTTGTARETENQHLINKIKAEGEITIETIREPWE